jgi:hypothetical protein
MQIDLIPTLISQLRETMEGAVGSSWITDGQADSGVLGFIQTLPAEQAYQPSRAGGRSVAEHVAHLRFALDLTRERWSGNDPPADWGSSFDLTDRSPTGWDALRTDLRRAYDGVLNIVLETQRTLPRDQWPDLYFAGLSALIGHNAYHLGSIRQIAMAVAQK